MGGLRKDHNPKNIRRKSLVHHHPVCARHDVAVPVVRKKQIIGLSKNPAAPVKSAAGFFMLVYLPNKSFIAQMLAS